MAATIEGRRLTEAHRQAQARLGAQLAQLMFAAWALIDIDDLDGTFARWLRTVLPLIQSQRDLSSQVAATYLVTFRALELGVEEPPLAPTAAPLAPREAVATSLLVTGPAALRSATARGMPLGMAAQLAQARSAAAAIRHALNGGRETIVESTRADRRAVGWARATSGRACHFCLMLASRGPVYRSDEAADFQAHDHCSCTAEPVYRRDADWPPGARDARRLWDDTTSGLSGAEARAAFRRAVETRA